MEEKWTLRIVCTECFVMYDVKMINARESRPGMISGYVGSDVEFCSKCGAPDVEIIGATPAKE